MQGFPHHVFVFGDNMKQFGKRGQAKALRGEPNAVGIPTKNSPGWGPRDYFSDDDYELNCWAIDAAFKKIYARNPQAVVLPMDGIGTGLADLKKKAPRTYGHLENKLRELGAFPAGAYGPRPCPTCGRQQANDVFGKEFNQCVTWFAAATDRQKLECAELGITRLRAESEKQRQIDL